MLSSTAGGFATSSMRGNRHRMCAWVRSCLRWKIGRIPSRVFGTERVLHFRKLDIGIPRVFGSLSVQLSAECSCHRSPSAHCRRSSFFLICMKSRNLCCSVLRDGDVEQRGSPTVPVQADARSAARPFACPWPCRSGPVGQIVQFWPPVCFQSASGWRSPSPFFPETGKGQRCRPYPPVHDRV